MRLRAAIDALAAHRFGIDVDDFRWILRGCDHPIEALTDTDASRALSPTGFWRVDRDQPPELRHTVLSLVAFHDLRRLGVDAFLAQNDGEGWMLPDTLRLADYGLGHDDRAREPQPVASRLGPRFYDWQLAQGVAESWEECERHAEKLRSLLPFEPERDDSAASGSNGAAASPAAAPAPDASFRPAGRDLFGNPIPTDLFGSPIQPKSRRR